MPTDAMNEAVTVMRARLGADCERATPEQIQRLPTTQWLALNIAVRHLGWAVADALPRPLRQLFRP